MEAVRRGRPFPKTWVPLIAAVLGLTGVAAGAFGAHGIEGEQAKAWVATGAEFQLIHALAALATLSLRNWGAAFAVRAAPFFFAGVACFSFSLYALALGAPRGVAMLAPVGGLSFLIGWAILIAAGVRLARGPKEDS